MSKSGKWLRGASSGRLQYYPENSVHSYDYKYAINLSTSGYQSSHMDIINNGDWSEEVLLQSLFQDYLNPQEAELILFQLDYNCEYPIELIRELSNEGD